MSEQTVSIPMVKINAVMKYLVRFDNVDESGINSKYLKDLQESDPSNWPPIIVTPDGQNGYYLVDGYHRFLAAEAMGVKTIFAVVSPKADRELAFDLNREHGLRLTIKDRKEHARWLHEKYPTLSGRELARRTGLNHVTVNKAITESSGENNQSDDFRFDNSGLLSVQRANAAKAILHYMEKLWMTRGLIANFDLERGVREMASALHDQAELNPEYQQYLQVLKTIVDLAVAPVAKANKSH